MGTESERFHRSFWRTLPWLFPGIAWIAGVDPSLQSLSAWPRLLDHPELLGLVLAHPLHLGPGAYPASPGP